MSSGDQYLGNPLLKKANTPIEFTKDNIEQYIKCKNDPVYFARNYIKIVSLDHGLVPFDMYKFQEKLISNFHDHRFNICKMPRQSGKYTLLFLIYFITQYLMITSILRFLPIKHLLLETFSEDFS